MSQTGSQDDPWAAVPGQAAGGPSAYPGGAGAPGYGYPPSGTVPPPYYYQYQPYPVRKTNGMAVASLVCGICGFIYLVPAILGIVFGSVALRQTRRDGSEGRGMAIAGIVTGSAWLLLGVLVVILVIALAN
jgi:hypothetical protein